MYLWFGKKVPLIVVMTTWKHGFMLSLLTYSIVVHGGMYTSTFKAAKSNYKSDENNDTAVGG